MILLWIKRIIIVAVIIFVATWIVKNPAQAQHIISTVKGWIVTGVEAVINIIKDIFA